MKKSWRGEEKRKMARISASIKVKYRILKQPKLKYGALSRDISGLGVGLLVNKKLREGIDLELEIDIPRHDRPVLAKGRVVWVKSIPGREGENFATGIKFTQIAPEDETRLIESIYG